MKQSHPVGFVIPPRPEVLTLPVDEIGSRWTVHVKDRYSYVADFHAATCRCIDCLHRGSEDC